MFPPSSSCNDIPFGLFVCLYANTAKLVLLASLFRFGAGFSIGIWKAPFIFEKFPESIEAFSSGNALIISIGGLASSLIGGALSDRLSNPQDPNTRPRARAWVPALGSLLAVPSWIAFCQTDNAAAAAAFLFIEYIVAECW